MTCITQSTSDVEIPFVGLGPSGLVLRARMDSAWVGASGESRNERPPLGTRSLWVESPSAPTVGGGSGEHFPGEGQVSAFSVNFLGRAWNKRGLWQKLVLLNSRF